MADTASANYQFILMETGSDAGAWGQNLNGSMISLVDQVLSKSTNVTLSSSDIALTVSQCQTLAFTFTGTLTTNVSVSLPFQYNSTATALSGEFICFNNATGSFSVTVNTTASGSTGVIVPFGVRTKLYSDGTNVNFVDNAQNQTQTYAGNPNGNVAGQAGSASTRADRIINRSTNEEYICTTSGTASAAVWSINFPFTMPAQGYLTLNSDATNIIVSTDTVGATSVYYSPKNGNLMWLYNGVSFSPVSFSQLILALSASSQGANNFYDVFGFLNGTSSAVAFGPAWATPTAGSGSRGTGAGTTQLARVNGILTNAVSISANNGASTYSIGTSRGTYLGTVFVDGTGGQVSCYITAGQSRKWGVWNAYNREKTTLQGRDSTSSWSVTSSNWEALNNNVANVLTIASGMPEESFVIDFSIGCGTSGNVTYAGLGANSTSSPSGSYGAANLLSASAGVASDAVANYDAAPFIGINKIYAIQKCATSTNFYGGQQMSFTARFMA